MNSKKANLVVKTIKKLANDSDSLTFNDLRIIVAIERLIARLESNSYLSGKLIYKGGYVLMRTTDSSRFTRDIDASTSVNNFVEFNKYINEAISTDLDDGMWFGDIKVQDLASAMPYPGKRFNMAFQIGLSSEDPNKLKKLSRIHLDVAFGEPEISVSNLSTGSFIESEKPLSWKVYPFEKIAAEKIHAVISRGNANSRAKDIYDLVFMLENNHIDEKKLLISVHNTFELRDTQLPSDMADFVERLDTTVLKNSWNSVELGVEKEEFDNLWERFKVQLSNIRLEAKK